MKGRRQIIHLMSVGETLESTPESHLSSLWSTHSCDSFGIELRNRTQQHNSKLAARRTSAPASASRRTKMQRHRSLSSIGVESLETRQLFAADPLPVLMVIADQHDFYYREYNDTAFRCKLGEFLSRLLRRPRPPATRIPTPGKPTALER